LLGFRLIINIKAVRR